MQLERQEKLARIHNGGVAQAAEVQEIAVAAHNRMRLSFLRADQDLDILRVPAYTCQVNGPGHIFGKALQPLREFVQRDGRQPSDRGARENGGEFGACGGRGG